MKRLRPNTGPTVCRRKWGEQTERWEGGGDTRKSNSHLDGTGRTPEESDERDDRPVRRVGMSHRVVFGIEG